MRRIWIAATLAALGVANGEDTPDEAHPRKARELVELTGAMETLPGAHADLPRDQLLEIVVPIYAKHLDEETLDAAIAFLRSPLGAKYATGGKAAFQEARTAASAWVKRVFDEKGPEGKTAAAEAKCKEYFDTVMCWRTMSEGKKFPENLEQMEAPLRPGEPNFATIVLDPWGHKYVLHIEGRKAAVASFGPDGVEGTDDDIVYPKR